MKRRTTMSGAALLGAALCVGLLGAGPAAPKATEFGRGPTVVLVHGLGSNRMVWMPTAKKLLGAHRVVLADLAGHGESPLPDPFSLRACADALDGLLAKYSADSTVLVGQGVGGVVALLEAQAHPERIRGLVIIDAALKSPVPVPDQQQRRFLVALDQRYDDIVRGIFTSMGRDSVQGKELHAQATLTPPPTIKAYIGALLNVDATAALKDLKPPLLFVASERVWAADKDWPTLAKSLGFGEVGPLETRRIAECGPLIMREQPDSLATVLAEFTARAIAAKK